MKTIEEKNRMIAEFMGHEEEQTENGEFVYAIEFQNPEKLNDIQVEFFCAHELKYHTSWDWLMPVVDAIYNTGMDEQTTNEIGDVTHALLDVDINSLHDAVVKFIEFYNESK